MNRLVKAGCWIALVLVFFGIQNLHATQCSSITLSSQAEVNAFPQFGCDTIMGNLTIVGTDITSLDSLLGLKYVDGFLYIIYSGITDLDGLDSLTRINQQLLIDNCDALTDVSVLSAIDSIPSLVIEHCSILEAIHINGNYLQSIQIQYDSSLQDIILDDIDNIFIGGFIVNYNPELVSIQGLHNIVDVEAHITITHNNSLSNIDAFQNLRIAGNISIEHNPVLTRIDFFDNLSFQGSVEGGLLAITNNASLTAVRFPLIRSFQRFWLEHNPQLDHCCFVYEMLSHDLQFESFQLNGNGINCNSLAQVFVNCSSLDPDNDLILNPVDNCAGIYNANQSDWDSDGVGNACDNCVSVANPGQQDVNGNGIGDACEVTTPKVGINTTQPVSALQLETGEIYVKEPSRGIIIRNAEGTCYRIMVDTYGLLKAVAVVCPE